MIFKRKIFFYIISVLLVISSLSYGKTKYSEILDRKIFADTPPQPQKNVTSILKPAPLPPLESIITLKGIIYCPDGKSKVIIQINSKKTEVLCEQEDIIENAKIIRINESNLVFLYDDKEVILGLQKPNLGTSAISIKDSPVKAIPYGTTYSQGSSVASTGIFNTSDNIPKPDQPRNIKINDIVEKFRSDPSLFANVSVSPYIQEGRVEGFAINKIPEGINAGDVGIQVGDVIKRVNGVLIDSLGKAYAVYTGLTKSQSKLATVEILRNGQPIILTYRLD